LIHEICIYGRIYSKRLVISYGIAGRRINASYNRFALGKDY